MTRVLRLRPWVLLCAVVLMFGPADPAQAVPPRTPLPTGTDVDYQLGGAAPTPAHVGIVARDRLDRPAKGRYNVCYVNGFQTQPNERRFWQHHRRLLLEQGGRPVTDEAWGEWLLDVRTAAKRRALARIVGGWVKRCARDGFDAVEFDNLDSFTRSHGLLKRRHNLAFARMLVRRAHRSGLAAGQKNLAGFNGRRLAFDFAVAEECAQWRECKRYVRHYGDRVLMIEYRASAFRRGCRKWGSSHPIVLRDRALRPGFGGRRYC